MTIKDTIYQVLLDSDVPMKASEIQAVEALSAYSVSKISQLLIQMDSVKGDGRVVKEMNKKVAVYSAVA